MAEDKTTTQLEPPPAWAIEGFQRLADKITATNANLGAIATTIDTLVEDGKSGNQRMTRIEVRLDTLESRASTTSDRVRGESETNLNQDAAISSILTSVEELKKRPDTAATVLLEVNALAGNPIIKRLGQAAVGVAFLAISWIGVRLQSAVTALEQRPAVVQPAPTVYLSAAATDGGAP